MAELRKIEQIFHAPPEVRAVEMRDVRKEFGAVVAVSSIDLDIANGEIVGLIGPSGSGKTTAIRLILGIYAPTSGSVLVYGEPPSEFSRPEREVIGYLPQHFLLYPELTVDENLDFIASAYGLGWRTRKRRIPELLETVRLSDARDRLAQDISGGMQRRLALASALIHEPRFLVLDEPTAGIDPVLRASFWQMFRQLQSDGCTFVVTTQYVTEAEYCDRVALIDQGEVIAIGSPAELRRQALGGEMVRVTIPDLSREMIQGMLGLPDVRRAERQGDASVLLTVDDAGTAIPAITDHLRNKAYDVSAVEEFRQSFDEVFVRLLAQRGKTLAPPL